MMRKRLVISEDKIKEVDDLATELLTKAFPEEGPGALITDLSCMSDFTIGWDDKEWRKKHKEVIELIEKDYQVTLTDKDLFHKTIYQICVEIIEQRKQSVH